VPGQPFFFSVQAARWHEIYLPATHFFAKLLGDCTQSLLRVGNRRLSLLFASEAPRLNATPLPNMGHLTAEGTQHMNEPTIQFPVTCPECGKEALNRRPVAKVAGAILSRTDQLELYAPCHGRRWVASKSELEQIREYLGAWFSIAPSELGAKPPR
jgi:hypothetical protein